MVILSIGIIKLSILFFYRRVFRGRTFDIMSWVVIGLVVTWTTTFFISYTAACGTSITARFQTLGALKHKCANVFELNVSLSVTDVAVDLAILLMPIPLVS